LWATFYSGGTLQKRKEKLQEPILPNFIFLHFLIFVFKLSHIVKQENNAIGVKWPSLIAKNSKMSILERLAIDL
jgi:hypothetical protein